MSCLVKRSLRSICYGLTRLQCSVAPRKLHHLPPQVPTPYYFTRHLTSVPSPPEQYDINLSPEQLHTLLDSCHVVDVRQPEELVAYGAVPGAVNIPLGELEHQLSDIPSENTVFVCQRGIRSLTAISLALKAGFQAPRHLQGGMEAWNEVFKK